MFKKSLITLIIIAFVLCLFAPAAMADDNGALIDTTSIKDYPKAPTVSTDAIILIEAKSGTILFKKNADVKHYPASITKILTALIVLENCSLDETVTFSYSATHDLEEGSSGIARTEGEQMSVKECLYGMLVASANECAQALAEHVSGSISAFADLMNEKADELGCTNSHFTNPSGLNNEAHYTTCYDMALIMKAAIANPDFVEIDSSVTHTIPATNKHTSELPISMTHELLTGSSKYKWAVCGKTGYTNAAGYTLVTYATKSNLDLICVTMGNQTTSQRASSSIAAFDFGFDNFTSYDISDLSSDFKADSSTSSFLSPNILSLSAASGSAIVVPNDFDINDLTTSIAYNSAATKDGVIGRVIYKSGDTPISQADLVVDTSAHEKFAFLKNDTSGEVSDAETSEGISFVAILIIIAVVFVILIILGLLFYRYINGSSRRKRKGKVKVDKRLGIK